MQQQLNWPTLQQRQQRSRLVFFIKLCKIRTITLEIPHYCTTAHGPTRHETHPYPSSRTNVYTCIAIFQEL